MLRDSSAWSDDFFFVWRRNWKFMSLLNLALRTFVKLGLDLQSVVSFIAMLLISDTDGM